MEVLLREQTPVIIGSVFKTSRDQADKRTHYDANIECIPVYIKNKEVANSSSY